MSELSLRFEPADLAGWLWGAVGIGIAYELIRYVRIGRWPRSRLLRAGLSITTVVVLITAAQTDRFRFDGSTHAYACAVLAAGVAVWLVRGYARTTRAISGSVRVGLLILRATAAGIVLLIASGPVVQQTTVTHQKPLLGIAVDDSRSMSIRDVRVPASFAEPLSRHEAVTEAIDRLQSVLKEAANTLDVQWFVFDEQATPVQQPSLKAAGAATAIGDAVRQIRTALTRSQQPTAGIVVISDGRENTSSESPPEAAAAGLASAGIPLYTIGVGSETPLSDKRSLLARRLDVPAKAAAYNRLPARAEFLAVGLAGQAIRCELLLDGNVVATRSIEPHDAVELIRVDMSCIPTEDGIHRLTVRATAKNVEEPAEIPRFVQITGDKIEVLYIDRPRYERAAVTRALAAARELHVTRRDPKTAPNASHSSNIEELRQARVIIVGDAEPTAVPQEFWDALADAASKGTGVVMLGGARSLGSGRYAITRLAGLMPVDLAVAGQLSGPRRIELTPAGRLHPVCHLENDPAANERRWKELPATDGASMLGEPKPGSEVLLQTPEGNPLLVVGETGAGRTAAVAFDSTWKWAFAGDDGAETQRRFWRQLVLWLANRRPDVWVGTDRQEYDLVELKAGRRKVRVEAGITDIATGTPVTTASVSADLQGPGGKREAFSLTAGEKSFSTELRPSEPGDYRIEIIARSDKTVLGRSRTAFTVTSVDRELADPLPDLQLLRRMAAETHPLGGAYAPLVDLDSTVRDIAAGTRPTEIRHVRRWHLVHDHPWPWYTAFVALLALEWGIRRIKGLV